MAKSYANVQPGFDTFAAWVTKTNSLLYDMSTIIVTTESNTTGAVTSGNATVNGIFGANTVFVGSALRGGSVTTNGVLVIVSNTTFSNSIISVGNSSVNVSINSTAFSGRSATANALSTARNIAVTTDATGNANFDGSANISIALTLVNVATSGTYGNATHYPVVTIDAKGRVTSVTNTAITLPAASYVASFNTRTGAVTLSNTDVVNALAYTPVSANSSGSINGNLTLTNNGDITARDLLATRDVRVGNSTVNTVISGTNTSIYTPTFRGTKDTVNANTTATGAMVLDLSYNIHRWTMTGNISSLNFSNVPANNTSYTGTLYVTRDGSTNATNRVITFPTSANATTGKALWAGGTQPPQTSNANAVDVYQFSTIDGGNNYIWSLVVKDAR